MAATHANNPSQTPSFHRFFDLSAELREQILGHVCHHPNGIFVGAQPYTLRAPVPLGEQRHAQAEYRVPATPPMGLFLASYQLHAEAADVFYRSNVWHVLSFVTNPLSYPALMSLLNSPEAAPARARMSKVMLHVRRFGGFLENDILPSLRKMVLEDNLRCLHVRVHNQLLHQVDNCASVEVSHALPPSLPQGQDGQVVRPLRELVRLLADPYLRRARVEVEYIHWRFWCPFHTETDEVVTKNIALAARDLTRRAGFKQWLEVNLVELVRKCGGEDLDRTVAQVQERFGSGDGNEQAHLRASGMSSNA